MCHHQPPGHSLTICTEGRLPVSQHMRSLLNGRLCPVTPMWVPDHKKSSGAEAKTTSTATSNPPRSISYASTSSLIHRTLTDPPPPKTWISEVYGGFSWYINSSPEGIRQSHRPLRRSTLPFCKEEQRLDETRQNIHKSSSLPLTVLTINPERSFYLFPHLLWIDQIY